MLCAKTAVRHEDVGVKIEPRENHQKGLSDTYTAQEILSFWFGCQGNILVDAPGERHRPCLNFRLRPTRAFGVARFLPAHLQIWFHNGNVMRLKSKTTANVTVNTLCPVRSF